MFKFLEPFFRALSDGKIIRLTVAWVLRSVAILGALGGVFWFLAFLALGFNGYSNGFGNHSPGVLIGSILFALFGLCLGYLWAGVCWFRARSVVELGDSKFTVLSIVSILFRLNGELVFITYSLLGVGGCLFVWLADMNPISELRPLAGRIPFAEFSSSGFLGGIELLIIFLLIAFLGIVLSYALAELSIVLVEIALNTRRSAGMSPGYGPASVPSPQPPAPMPSTPNPAFASSTARSGQTPVCKQCGQILERGAAFCGECGSAAGEEWQANTAGNAVIR